MKNTLYIEEPFVTETGGEIRNLEVVYHTFGEKAPDDSNVVWICHALTANSDPTDWWDGLVGDGKMIDPADKYVVCVNIIGSPYGTSSPTSQTIRGLIDSPEDFPFFTIRDVVRVHSLVRKELNINRIPLALGGSMGGYQVLEWLVMEPEIIEKAVLLACGASESPWGRAIHESQRLAIQADPSWNAGTPDAGRSGLIAARGIGMVSYRNYETFVATQSDPESIVSDHRASSYIIYQGEKLANRFNAYDYWALTRTMDSHDLGRGRGDLEKVLAGIRVPVLVIGISSDLLCPTEEQKKMAAHIPQATYLEIHSRYGHDGFLIESEAIQEGIENWDS